MFLKNPSNIGLACLLVSYPFISPLAYNAIPGRYAFSGSTIGVGIGANTFMTKITQSDVLEAVTIGTSFDASNRIYQYGIMGNILAGYGNVYSNCFYLGTELGLNFFQPTETSFSYTAQANLVTTFDDLDLTAATSSTVHSTIQVSRKNVEPTLDIKIGTLVTPYLLAYLRGGINYDRIQIKSQTVYETQGIGESLGPPPTLVSTSSLFTVSQSKNAIGFRAGAGMEYMATPCLGVSANYIYTFYKNLTNNASGTANAVTCDFLEGCVINGVPVEQLNKAKANDQQVLVGLIYHFG